MHFLKQLGSKLNLYLLPLDVIIGTTYFAAYHMLDALTKPCPTYRDWTRCPLFQTSQPQGRERQSGLPEGPGHGDSETGLTPWVYLFRSLLTVEVGEAG